jgi:hypothetical protein
MGEQQHWNGEANGVGVGAAKSSNRGKEQQLDIFFHSDLPNWDCYILLMPHLLRTAIAIS